MSRTRVGGTETTQTVNPKDDVKGPSPSVPVEAMAADILGISFV
jgi:hypothetical protein